MIQTDTQTRYPNMDLAHRIQHQLQTITNYSHIQNASQIVVIEK